ncbi:hypothetical protein EVA_01032 [gut metagenome]|uniref:Uncharacterized protein n=1 Tax=gut metagenome TaxID=749906 RepID=J9GRN4_9ZZZZ
MKSFFQASSKKVGGTIPAFSGKNLQQGFASLGNL